MTDPSTLHYAENLSRYDTCCTVLFELLHRHIPLDVLEEPDFQQELQDAERALADARAGMWAALHNMRRASSG